MAIPAIAAATASRGSARLRGAANNVSNALGAALTSVVAVALLGMFLASDFAEADLPPGLEPHVLFDDVDFVTNDELRSVLGATPARTEQVDQWVAINQQARLRALRAAFLIVAGISLLAVFPAARLPKYVPSELSASDLVSEPSHEMQAGDAAVDSGSNR